jgi:hypothetical protein
LNQSLASDADGSVQAARAEQPSASDSRSTGTATMLLANEAIVKNDGEGRDAANARTGCSVFGLAHLANTGVGGR